MLNRLQLLLLHASAAMILLYLSYMIVMKKRIHTGVGVFLGLLAVFVVIGHVYLYMNPQKRGPPLSARSSGLSFDPNSGNYKPIGGIGGSGWL